MRKSRSKDEQILRILHEVDAEAKRLKAREDENRRLKKLVADLSLDNQLLNEMVGRKW